MLEAGKAGPRVHWRGDWVSILETEVSDNLVNERGLRESHGARCTVTIDGDGDAELCFVQVGDIP
ncbi:uncharacterized protein LAESUDRAFT_638887 [Laetiporus sulphureus 93-53]|uniref:Uncharacterized protein n=1 Tax=Laetiporus sulphureus 93-53 TaxID=1314785 RepID=A0A165IJ30_9APHY|nr:uncharacterized protein LAESUDRAFT_638887 [Laetiporus sulphureus 93-53]KZT13147.1 hypothetical protein LAESUDRAFT_638887 [Laetiporus sulphureus 93-53]